MSLLKYLEENMTKEELINKARSLNKLHNPYLMDFQVWELLLSVLGKQYKFYINNYKKELSPFKEMNGIIMKYCPGERIIKYHIVKDHVNNSDEITLFEMNINNSRVDIGRVNGKSIAYEIKTEFDSLSRLDKQINDYSKVFEYVYVITHETHLEKVAKIVPEFCGIKTYKLENDICKFYTKRKAVKNINIDKFSQVKNLTSEELRIMLKSIKNLTIPNTRNERERLVFERINERKINCNFKLLIKRRYERQWNFLRDNFNEILPVDVQSFFHSPIDPQSIYAESIYLDYVEI